MQTCEGLGFWVIKSQYNLAQGLEQNIFISRACRTQMYE